MYFHNPHYGFIDRQASVIDRISNFNF